MNPRFNIDRPKVSDEEIKKHQDFDRLVEQFKKQSLKKARGDESWWKNKKVRYTTAILGITVVCTVTYLSLLNDQKTKKAPNETIITQKTSETSTTKTDRTRPVITPPSSKLRTAYSTYTVNGKKGGKLKHHTASAINVAPGSFVNKQGKEIIGDVTIEYREFHDLADVVLSGIPMRYDSAGHNFNLESAGMFDIRGTVNGEPVYIKPEKPIEVSLASLNSEDRFNQYIFDTAIGNWKYIKRDDLNKNNNERSRNTVRDLSIRVNNLEKEVTAVIPARIDSVKRVFTSRAAALPRPTKPNAPNKPTEGRPSFKLEGSYSEFPELASFDNVVFEVGPENRNYSPELHAITWSDVKISEGPVKGKNYFLTLSYRNRIEKLIVYPVITGKDLAKAEKQFAERLGDYNSALERRQKEEKRLLAEMETRQAAYFAELKRKQAELADEKEKLRASLESMRQNEMNGNFNSLSNASKASRLFKVASFGIYNSDCPHPKPAPVLNARFVAENGMFVKGETVYLVNHTANSVFQYNFAESQHMNYDPDSEYSVYIFRGELIYHCDRSNFKKGLKHAEKKFMVSELNEANLTLSDFKKTLSSS